MATTYNISIVVEGKDRGATSMLQGLQGGLGGILQIAGGTLLAGALYKIGQGIVSIGEYAFSTVGKMQQLEMSLSTLAATELLNTGRASDLNDALAKSAPLAEELLHWIRDLSLTSPFQYETVAAAFQYQKAFGGTIEMAKIATEATLDFAAAVGLDSAGLDRLSYALAQTSASGRITMADIRQLSNSRFGIQQLNGVFEQLSETTGVVIKDHNEFNAAIEQGKITTEDFFKAFGTYVDENFAGAAKRMTTTLPGLMSNIKDIFFFGAADLFGGVGEVLATSILPIVNGIMSWIQSGAIAEWGERLAANVTSGLGALQQLAGPIMQLFEAIGDAGFGSIEMFEVLENILGTGLTNALRQLWTWAQTAFGIIRDFWETQGPTIVANIQANWAAIREGIDYLSARIGPFVTNVLGKFSAWFTENGPLIREYTSQWAAVFRAIVPIVVRLWNVVGPILEGIIDLLLDSAKIVMAVFTGDWQTALEGVDELLVNLESNLENLLMGIVDVVASVFGSSVEEVQAGLIAMDESFATWAKGVGDTFLSWLDSGLADLDRSFSDWSAGVGDSFSSGLGSVGSSISAWWDSVVQGFRDLFTRIGDGIRAGVATLFQIFSIGFLVLLGLAVTFLDNLLAPFGTTTVEIVRMMRQAFINLREIVSATVANIVARVTAFWAQIVARFNFARAILQAVMIAVWGIVRTVWGQITSAIQERTATIVANISLKLNEMRNIVSTLLGAVRAKFTEIWDAIRSSITTRLNEITSAVRTKVNEWISAIREKISDFQNVGSGIADAVKAGIENAWSAIKSWFIGLIQDLIDKALGVIGEIGGGGGGNHNEPVTQGVLGGMDALQQVGAGLTYNYNSQDQSARYYGPVTYQINGQATIAEVLAGLRV